MGCARGLVSAAHHKALSKVLLNTHPQWQGGTVAKMGDLSVTFQTLATIAHVTKDAVTHTEMPSKNNPGLLGLTVLLLLPWRPCRPHPCAASSPGQADAPPTHALLGGPWMQTTPSLTVCLIRREGPSRHPQTHRGW